MREALIRPAHIAQNVSSLHAAAGTTESMLVVKANGYGHGALTAARAGIEGGATWLGTADIDEALALRAGGLAQKILAWLIGPQSPVAEAIDQGIHLGLSSRGQLEQVAAHSSTSRPAQVHLKIDSGMGRGGITASDWPDVMARAVALQRQGLIEVKGIFTHLSLASVAMDQDQLDSFEKALVAASEHGIDPEWIHAGASVGSIRTPGRGYDLARFGISAYGFPVVDQHLSLGLKPAMRLSGQVILTKRLPAGHGVGYDLTYRTSAETTMAVIPLGYADGLPRQASGQGPLSLGGVRYRVAGRISMDQISVDVGDAPVAVGDWAVIFGDPEEGHPSAADWAQAAGTIPYEIVSLVGARVPRVIQ